MKTDLTKEQIEFYQENGFLVYEDLLSPDELEEWREVLQESIENRGNHILPTRIVNDLTESYEAREQAKQNDDTQYYSNVFIQRVNLWMDNPRMKELILNPAIGKMCCQLEGIDGIRVWHDQMLTKEPWGNPTAWHLDNPYWSFTSEHAISIWIALDDATLENGCLWYIPGSHKKRTWENVGIGHDMGALFKIYPEWAKIKAVPAVMKAGSCGFHNGLTAHAANANMTPGLRRAMTCAFMPDGATFNGRQNVLPREKFKKLQIGDPLNDEDQNPIVWHKQMETATV